MYGSIIMTVLLLIVIILILCVKWGWLFSDNNELFDGSDAENKGNMDEIEKIITKCPTCPTCPTCPDCSKQNEQVIHENKHLKLLSKYLTILVRKNEAERELYALQSGRRQVFHSPRIIQLNRQLTIFKKKIREDKNALQYFNDNLDLLL